MKKSLIVLVFLVCAVTKLALAAGAAPTNSLTAFRQQFDQAINAAGTAYVQQIADKPGQYLKSIETLEAERRQAGDLEAVVALRQARLQFRATTNVVMGDAQAEPSAVRNLKQQYLDQLARCAEQRDQMIVAAAGTYTNQLALLKIQLARAGKTGEALLVQDEAASIQQDARVKAATLIRHAESETHGDTATTSAPPETVTAAVPGLSPDRLLNEATVSFRFTEAELDTPADLLTRLAQRCLNAGVRLRAATNHANIKTVQAEGGKTTFVVGPRTGPTRSRGRAKTLTFDTVPLRTVLQAICAGIGLGYALGSDSRELVLVDADDPKAIWMPDLQSPGEILKALQIVESRRQHIGRALLFTGEVTGTVQGLNEFVLALKDGTKLGVPSTGANRVRLERIRTALGATEKRDRTGVEVTALATIRSESSAQGLVLGDAVLLEVYGVGSTDMTVPAGLTSPTGLTTPAAHAAHPIRRIGEP